MCQKCFSIFFTVVSRRSLATQDTDRQPSSWDDPAAFNTGFPPLWYARSLVFRAVTAVVTCLDYRKSVFDGPPVGGGSAAVRAAKGLLDRRQQQTSKTSWPPSDVHNDSDVIQIAVSSALEIEPTPALHFT
ncbi:hypothetical protein E2C01_032438 [Portunus trituberculatus]|uniref:Uncharacterized protein n=1 Tax=Portunus trituberculatus TaxID=210409 RepID=A0A5B7EV98_PORTR|nr:hypothetical protein [Portunus trituberculatus]